MQLYIGNKNYSSWSMRPWVLMKQAGIPFDEVMLRFDGFDAGSAFKSEVARLNPAGRVPVLEPAIWAENVPFAETRDYVKKVLSNATYYAAQLGTPAPSLQQRLGRSIAPAAQTNPLDKDLP